jgi:uncharacterized protein YjiS (DUF1127 family)
MRPPPPEAQASSGTTETLEAAARHLPETRMGELQDIEGLARRRAVMLKFLKQAVQRADRRHRAMFDYRMMQAMDERMLRDIGITRADVDEARRRVRWMV